MPSYAFAQGTSKMGSFDAAETVVCVFCRRHLRRDLLMNFQDVSLHFGVDCTLTIIESKLTYVCGYF